MITMMLALALHAGADERVDDACYRKLFRITRDLLHADGFTRINTCAGLGSADQCELTISETRRKTEDGRYVYQARFTYGGAYPNYVDFTLTGDEACVIRDIHIDEM